MICKQCKKEFTETHHLQKYCSKECSNKNYNREYYKKNRKKIIKQTTEYSKKNWTKLYEKRKELRQKNLDHYQKIEKEKHLKNRSRNIKRMKRYYKKNKAKLIKQNTEYAKKNRDTINARIQKYRNENRVEFNSKKRAYERKKLKTDPIFRLKKNLNKSIRDALEGAKSKKTLEYLGVPTIHFFKKYIEKKFTKDMSWNNYGKWHLDHIIPIDYFIRKYDFVNDIKAQKKCMNYKNIQPLWASENIRKSNKII